MFFTGDIVLYEDYPYVFLELDSQQGIYALVRIHYTEKGWVYRIESKKDILTDINENDCDELKTSAISLDDICAEVGKYYEKSAIQQGVALQLDDITKKCRDLEDELFTCDLKELTKIRKKWRMSEVEKGKIQAKFDKEDKALDSKVKGIAKEFDDELLYTSQQLETDFDTGTNVRIFGEATKQNYILILPNNPTTYGYLYNTDSRTITVVERGGYYKTMNDSHLDKSLQSQLVRYVEELDKKIGIETQLDVYGKILETNRQAVMNEKDKEISTYRKVFDEVSEKIDLEKKKLKNVEKLCIDAMPSELERVVQHDKR